MAKNGLTTGGTQLCKKLKKTKCFKKLLEQIRFFNSNYKKSKFKRRQKIK